MCRTVSALARYLYRRFEGVYDVRQAVEAAAQQRVLHPMVLGAVATTLAAAASLRSRLQPGQSAPPFPALQVLGAGLDDGLPQLQQVIEQCIKVRRLRCCCCWRCFWQLRAGWCPLTSLAAASLACLPAISHRCAAAEAALPLPLSRPPPHLLCSLARAASWTAHHPSWPVCGRRGGRTASGSAQRSRSGVARHMRRASVSSRSPSSAATVCASLCVRVGRVSCQRGRCPWAPPPRGTRCMWSRR
jgi:hypothetical protein